MASMLAEVASLSPEWLDDRRRSSRHSLIFPNWSAARSAENEATQNQLELTETALADLLTGRKRQQPNLVVREHAARSKICSEEVVALSETIEILTKDDARAGQGSSSAAWVQVAGLMIRDDVVRSVEYDRVLYARCSLSNRGPGFPTPWSQYVLNRI